MAQDVRDGRPDPGLIEPDTLLAFKVTPQDTLHLHVFYPEDHDAAGRTSAIVFFFGGGWKGGRPAQFYPQARHLASLGMVAMAAEYRVEGAHGTTPFESVRDGVSAMRWVRAHAADRLGIDPERIAAGGGSAGGHIAAATALLDGFGEPGADAVVSARPDALVLFNPVIDNGPRRLRPRPHRRALPGLLARPQHRPRRAPHAAYARHRRPPRPRLDGAAVPAADARGGRPVRGGALRGAGAWLLQLPRRPEPVLRADPSRRPSPSSARWGFWVVEG